MELVVLVVLVAIFLLIRSWPKIRIQYLRKYAGQGNSLAQYRLAEAYSTGLGVEQDFEQASYWFKKASGRIGQPDNPKLYAQAVAMVCKEAKNGCVEAQITLALMYLYGDGVPQDVGQAVSWFREAAAQGDVDAQWSLGFMYYKGEKVRQDAVEAAFWIKKAADQGHVKAQELVDEITEDFN